MANADLKDINLDAFSYLSEDEKKLALEILKQYADTGKSELLNNLQYIDYDEIPVDIHTFLHDKKYLGAGLYDSEGRFTLFPFWEEVLGKIFPDNLTTAYNTVVLTGAIGIGKTLIADLIVLYMLYRLLCLKDPYQFFGMQPIDKLTVSFMNITLDNARGVALDKFNQLILSSEWFMSHGEMRGQTHLMYHPEKHIEFVVASSNNQIIGRALFASFEDEVDFGLTANPEKQKKKMLTIITQIDARMRSRFMRTKPDGTAYLPTINIIASSKSTEQAFLETYINEKIKNESKTTLIIDKPQWVVDSRKDSPIKFYVAIGNKFLANELIPLNVTEEQLSEYRARGYQLIQVPIGYLETFQGNLDESISSIIGIATASALKYISGVKLNETKVATYKNPFVKDVIEVGNSPNDLLQYSNFFDLSAVSENDKALPLFIHLDMSMTGDKTGIAGVWITGKEKNIKMLPDNNNQTQDRALLDNSGITDDLHYKLAFSVSVKAPKAAQVSFAKNRNFIRWLREQGFAIKCVSMDTFQSASIKQDLTADGFNTEIVSVDRLTKDARGKLLCLPYHYLKNAIYERRITLYNKCDLLTDELVGLERKSDGHIDHTIEGINSKDQADAVCGATWSASKFSEEFSYSYGDALDITLDVNEANLSAEYKKQQLISSFEAEVLKIGNEFTAGYQKQAKEMQEEQQYYTDLSNGIIIL